jgi:hypothetical protein
MTRCLFVADLHGAAGRYAALFAASRAERPAAVFLGGDLFPSGLAAAFGAADGDFVRDVLAPGFARVRLCPRSTGSQASRRETPPNEAFVARVAALVPCAAFFTRALQLLRRLERQ